MTLDDGRVVLVNRGWVPMDRLDPADRAAGQIAGPIALDAILRVGGWRGSETFRPRIARKTAFGCGSTCRPWPGAAVSIT